MFCCTVPKEHILCVGNGQSKCSKRLAIWGNSAMKTADLVSHLINGYFSCRLTLMCLNCDLLVDASGGDMMSKHLNDRTNHICKVIEEKGMSFEACDITLCAVSLLFKAIFSFEPNRCQSRNWSVSTKRDVHIRLWHYRHKNIGDNAPTIGNSLFEQSHDNT